MIKLVWDDDLNEYVSVGTGTTQLSVRHDIKLSGSLYMTGSIIHSVNTVTGNFEGFNEGEILLADATNAALTITLPNAAVVNKEKRIIKKIDTTANAVTIEGSGSQTIDGELNITITQPYASYTMLASGSSWFII